MSLENVDIPTLRNAIYGAHDLTDLAFPIVQAFNQYTKRITNPAKKKTLDKELLIFGDALQRVNEYGQGCVGAEAFINYMDNRPNRQPAELSDEQKKWVLDKVTNVKLGLLDALGVVVRVTPKRNELHGQAQKVLRHVALQPLLGGGN